VEKNRRPTGDAGGPAEEDRWERWRLRMVREQLEARDITEPRVLAVMRRVERHRFVPLGLEERAYDDGPLPIGSGQTISQPYIVALMTQLAWRPGARRALDVGTGSGYQAAVLAELVDEVHSLELVPELALSARERLERLGYRNIVVHQGDGAAGWPEAAPYDLIVVACAAREVPPALTEQLAPGARLVLPLGDMFQELWVIEKTAEGELRRQRAGAVAFVPMCPRSPARG
jgi:protein-L-isoaspartate(D-aspartate) O-methyltransferase